MVSVAAAKVKDCLGVPEAVTGLRHIRYGPDISGFCSQSRGPGVQQQPCGESQEGLPASAYTQIIHVLSNPTL